MKAHHIKWIVLAAVALFLFTSSAWADNNGKRVRPKNDRAGYYHAGHHRPNHHVDIRPYPRHPRPHHYRPQRRHHHHPRRQHQYYGSGPHVDVVVPPPWLLLPPFLWPHH